MEEICSYKDNSRQLPGATVAERGRDNYQEAFRQIAVAKYSKKML